MGRNGLISERRSGFRTARAGRVVRRFVAFGVRLVCVLGVLLFIVIGLGPRTGRYRVLTVLSGSMRPTMPVGAMIIVTPEPTDAVRTGQVITFSRPLPDQAIVTHRVVRVEHEHGHPVISTQGDANAAADPWRAELTDRTAWRARAVVPVAGRLLQGIRNRAVSHVGIVVVPVMLAAAWLVKIWFPAASEPSSSHDDPDPGSLMQIDAFDQAASSRRRRGWVAVGALGVLGVAAWSVQRKVHHA